MEVEGCTLARNPPMSGPGSPVTFTEAAPTRSVSKAMALKQRKNDKTNVRGKNMGFMVSKKFKGTERRKRKGKQGSVSNLSHFSLVMFLNYRKTNFGKPSFVK